MNRSIYIFIILICIVIKGYTQIYYHQSPGKVIISPNSKLLPVTTVTPSGITSSNPGSMPIAYNTAFSDQINQIFQPLNRSYVNTGLLKDYGIDFTDMTINKKLIV